MRIIKFRNWDKEKKELHYKDLRDAIIGDDIYSLCHNNCHHNGCECNIMQFTGLKDKYYKDIYEGDVVTWTGETNSKGIVWWQPARAEFVIDWSQTTNNKPENIGMTANMELKIIGNIYNDPKLLKYTK